MPKVDILCSDAGHPVIYWLNAWQEANQSEFEINIVQNEQDLSGGEFLFLISCHQLVRREIRNKYRFALVIHASDLPKGRGWSPMTWAVLEGADKITVTLLNAEDKIDSGSIWQKRHFELDGTELVDELNEKLFQTELELMDWALSNCDNETPVPQLGEATLWPRRSPADSEIDPYKSLDESFDKIRIADPDRFPAFFTLRGVTYLIRLEKMR